MSFNVGDFFGVNGSIDFSFEVSSNASKFRKSFSLWIFDKRLLLLSLYTDVSFVFPKQGSDHIALLFSSLLGAFRVKSKLFHLASRAFHDSS